MRNPLTAALVALSFLAGGAPGQTGDARLQQEVSNLKFRLDYETDRLERRLEAAERQLRALERGPAAVRASPQAPVPLSAGDELTLRRLAIVDEQGRLRATLAVSSIYGPMLGLLNEQGDVAVVLGAGPDGAQLELLDDLTVSRLRLGLRDGAARLQLAGPDGEVHTQVPPADVPRPR